MNTKTLVSLSLLVGIGTVLHTVVPGFFLGMKPDMMLTMMFLGIILFPEKKSVLLLGLVTGIISGLTTTFPGGLLPNIIDKAFTSFIILGLFLSLGKFKDSSIGIGFLTAFGTIVSGIVFLVSANFIVGLPGAFTALFAAVVLPAAAFNTFTMLILYPITVSIVKRTRITTKATKATLHS